MCIRAARAPIYPPHKFLKKDLKEWDNLVTQAVQLNHPIWGKMLLSQSLRFSTWQPLAVKQRPVKASRTLNFEGLLILALKALIVASGLTRNRQLPSVCTVWSLFTQLLFNLIWIFFFFLNKYSPPTRTMSQIDVQVFRGQQQSWENRNHSLNQWEIKGYF